MLPEHIEIGTSGWSFDDWVGVFYPLRVSRDRWLEYYSARFSIGELNSSYYRLPTDATINALQKRTPDAFRVFVKLHGDVTHTRQSPQDSCRHLVDTLQPLQESDKLMGLLAQFPAAFKFTQENFDYLLRIRDWTSESRLCVEVRDRSWDCADVLSVFRKENLTWVCPDEPALNGLLESRLQTTSSILYARLHGKNAATWYTPEAGDRYDYNYSETELEAWGKRLLNFTEEVAGGYLFFNNCHLGQAVKNATWLLYWIQERRGASGEQHDFTLRPT